MKLGRTTFESPPRGRLQLAGDKERPPSGAPPRVPLPNKFAAVRRGHWLHLVAIGWSGEALRREMEPPAARTSELDGPNWDRSRERDKETD